MIDAGAAHVTTLNTTVTATLAEDAEGVDIPRFCTILTLHQADNPLPALDHAPAPDRVFDHAARIKIRIKSRINGSHVFPAPKITPSRFQTPRDDRPLVSQSVDNHPANASD
jgi:hypothetical protein